MHNLKKHTLRTGLIILLIILSPTGLLKAAFELYPVSAGNAAIGRINMNVSGNFIDIMNEPSSLTAFNMKGGALIWNRPLQIKEIQQTAVAVGYIFKDWGFGVGASTYGNKLYSENTFTISAARKVKSRLNLGVNLSLYQLQITDYGTALAPGLSFSMRYKINNNWNWVSTARNVNLPKIGGTEEELPQIVTTGFIGNVHEYFTIVTEWEQDLGYDGTIKFGILAKPLKPLSFSVGYGSNPGQMTAGLTLNLGKIKIEYGTIAHHRIGLFTHQLGIGVDLNRR